MGLMDPGWPTVMGARTGKLQKAVGKLGCGPLSPMGLLSLLGVFYIIPLPLFSRVFIFSQNVLNFAADAVPECR